jgi:hypothetical protein
MTNNKSSTNWELEGDFQRRIRPFTAHAPWVLRITDHKDKPSPVLIVKRRFSPDWDARENGKPPGRPYLKDKGLLYGSSLRRCLPVIREIIARVCDDAGIPLELNRFFLNVRITFRGNLPLDEEAGAKLSLIFKLQERMKDMDRVELIARRVERFSHEETAYWLSRATQYGLEGNRWAQAGMRIMLGGQPKDKAVLSMLEKLRS